jgi:hypothetical protein
MNSSHAMVLMLLKLLRIFNQIWNYLIKLKMVLRFRSCKLATKLGVKMDFAGVWVINYGISKVL